MKLKNQEGKKGRVRSGWRELEEAQARRQRGVSLQARWTPGSVQGLWRLVGRDLRPGQYSGTGGLSREEKFRAAHPIC